MLQRLSGDRAGLYTYLVVAQPLGMQPGPKLRADPRTAVSELAADDPLVASFPRPAAINLARFASGGRCHAATVDGIFAGHLWTIENGYEEDEVRCRFVLPDTIRCCWDYDVYVVPRYRSGRTLARLWQAVDRRMSAEGFEWTLSRISRLNTASLLAHERLGAVPVAAATFLVAGPLQVMLASCAPRVHISLGARRRPALVLPAPRRNATLSGHDRTGAPKESSR
jgi:hypothetical protein